MDSMVHGRSLAEGRAAGALLSADVGLSFWGGVDPLTGTIIDRHHSLLGECLAGRVLAIPSGRGSCSGSGVLLELVLNGQAPAVVVTCGRAVLEAAERAGHVEAAEAFGVRFMTDARWCMIGEPVIPPAARTLMTNSGKYAHYAPGLVGRDVRFDSMAACVDAACAGRAGRRITGLAQLELGCFRRPQCLWIFSNLGPPVDGRHDGRMRWGERSASGAPRGGLRGPARPDTAREANWGPRRSGRKRSRSDAWRPRRRTGLDVELPLLIASANGASGPESGPCLKARNPPLADISLRGEAPLLLRCGLADNPAQPN